MAFLFALEGISGAQKTTTSRLLIPRLQELGIRVVDIRPQLDSGSVPRTVRSLTHPIHVQLTPQQEVLLYSTRLAYKRKLIDNYLSEDCVIFMDRYAWSIVVLGHYVRGLAYDRVRTIVDFAIQDRYPDLTIVLDLDYPTYVSHVQERPPIRKELGGKPVIESYMAGFRREFERATTPAVLLDARQPIERVVALELEAVLSHYSKSRRVSGSRAEILAVSQVEDVSIKLDRTKLLTLGDSNWPNFKCIVYDLEGTLFFSETFGLATTELGAECLASVRGISLDEARALLGDTRNKLSKDKGFRVSLTTTLVELDIDLNYWSTWQSKVDLREHTMPDPGIRACIADVSNQYTVFVLTNMTSQLAMRTLEFIGINDYVMELFTSDQESFAKPDIDIYRYLSHKYSLPPEEILSVGDRFHVDLSPAIAFGAYGFEVTNKDDLIALGKKLTNSHD